MKNIEEIDLSTIKPDNNTIVILLDELWEYLFQTEDNSGKKRKRT